MQEALGPKKTPRPSITKEVDEEVKNWTTNPMVGNREVLVEKIDKTNQGEPEDAHILMTWVNEMEDEIWINAKTSNSIKFQLQHGEQKEGLSLEEQIPKEYHEYLEVFDENKADRFPSS